MIDRLGAFPIFITLSSFPILASPPNKYYFTSLVVDNIHKPISISQQSRIVPLWPRLLCLLTRGFSPAPIIKELFRQFHLERSSGKDKQTNKEPFPALAGMLTFLLFHILR